MIAPPATTQPEHWDIHTSDRHTDALVNRPATAAKVRPAPTPTRRALARRMGFTEPCFADDDETRRRQAFGSEVDFQQLLDQRFASLRCHVPFAEGASPPIRPVRILQRARLAAA